MDEVTEKLRASIEAALRRRDPAVSEVIFQRPFGSSIVSAYAPGSLTWMSASHADENEALRRAARNFGLIVSDDGTVSDPADEVARLREEIAALRAAARTHGEAMSVWWTVPMEPQGFDRIRKTLAALRALTEAP